MENSETKYALEFTQTELYLLEELLEDKLERKVLTTYDEKITDDVYGRISELLTTIEDTQQCFLSCSWCAPH